MMTPNIWQKSTQSGPWTDNCLEAMWRTSSRSSNASQCVEVAGDPDGVLVRDTKDRGGGTLAFSPDSWAAFLAGIRGGEFDLT